METRRSRDKPVTDVFRIVNEHTRKTVEDPVTRVASGRHGCGSREPHHPDKKRRNGNPRSTTAAPHQGQDGSVTGVVPFLGTLREHKKAEERANHLASFLSSIANPVMEVDATGRVIFCNPRHAYGSPGSRFVGRVRGLLFPRDINADFRRVGQKDENVLRARYASRTGLSRRPSICCPSSEWRASTHST